MKNDPPRVKDHYDAEAENHSLRYDSALLKDINRSYPGNYFRLQLLLNCFMSKQPNRIIEIGVGERTPLCALAAMGAEVWGFDLSERMLEQARARFKSHGLDPEHLFVVDITDPVTYAHVLSGGQFDGLVAMGVLPHVENDDTVMRNIAQLIRPGGTAFIEFRNKLFSLFSFNRYTLEFFLDDLLSGVDQDLKMEVARDLEPRLRLDMPPEEKFIEGTDAPGYDAILSKFHNPFEVPPLLERNGFTGIELHWYHHHPAMPYLEQGREQILPRRVHAPRKTRSRLAELLSVLRFRRRGNANGRPRGMKRSPVPSSHTGRESDEMTPPQLSLPD